MGVVGSRAQIATGAPLNDPTSYGLVWDLLVRILALCGLWWAFKFISRANRRYPGAFQTRPILTSPTSPAPARPTDPCSHPYSPLPITDLIDHCSQHHFEIWNQLGPRDAPPSRWRIEHATDHRQEWV